MAETRNNFVPTLPIPIFRLASMTGRFMLYDIDVVTWLRREHHILGVLAGTLPQIPQQNVFLGLPLELMAEEVQLLVEKGVAYVVCDSDRHHALSQCSTAQDREAYQAVIRAQATEAFQAAEVRKELSKVSALRGTLNKKTDELDAGESSTTTQELSESLFDAADSQDTPNKDRKAVQDHAAKSWVSTPTSSFPLLPHPGASANDDRPMVQQSSYALFKYLHNNGYFLSPGLRFGCQFMAYPGDPLRYHSHFLATSVGWEDEVDLLDIIGEGRLGTGVKKGFLLGGLPNHATGSPKARAFCLEWGGM